MNCLEFRRVVGAEPRSAAPEVAEHAAQCAACARYQQQMQQMDSLIHRALVIDVTRPAAKPVVPRRRTLQWGLAASLLLAVTMGVFWLGYPRETLAGEVVQHVMHERGSLLPTATPISEAELADVLAKAHVRLKPGMGPVSYAMSCPFRGHRVPHFVVQTTTGPVTVLLLSEEKSVTKAQHFTEGEFQGVILPAPRGVLAVLGQNAPLDEVAGKVLAAVDYQTGW